MTLWPKILIGNAMKSIKIKLLHQNISKNNKLLSIFSDLEAISKDYLPIRLKELESKTYLPFKDHYANYRSKYPNLNSGILQNHLRKVDENIKGYIAICKKKKKLVNFPKAIRAHIPLRNDMFHFEFNEHTKKFNGWFKFLRAYYPLSLCDYHMKSLSDMTSMSDSSIIKDVNGQLYLRLVFKTHAVSKSTNNALGIDIGITKPIVCSDGKQFGSGAFIRHKKLEFGKKRAMHQKHKEAISKKQSNWTNDLNHKLSRELVDYCLQQGIDVLCLEMLKGSHLANKRFRRYNWAFKDLLTKITYKAQNAGLKVVGVDPRGTSQTCSNCGQKSKDNRRSQSLYECTCGYVANADINAAKNIQHLSVRNGPRVNQANGCTNQKLLDL